MEVLRFSAIFGGMCTKSAHNRGCVSFKQNCRRAVRKETSAYLDQLNKNVNRPPWCPAGRAVGV